MSSNVTDIMNSDNQDNKIKTDILDSRNINITDNVTNNAAAADNKIGKGADRISTYSENPEQLGTPFQLLYDNLKLNKFEEALMLLKGSEYEEYLKFNCLDIVPIITRVTKEDFCTIETEDCIEEMLDYIALIANKKEALIVFLEEAQAFRLSKHFRVLLKPFQTILIQQISSTSKFSTFSWVFSSINKHVLGLSFPTYDFLEEAERKLLDADPEYILIVDTYREVLNFYKPFHQKVMAQELIWPKENLSSADCLAYYLLNLFDKPLAFLDVYKRENETESNLYGLCENYVNMISSLIKNPFKYLELIKKNKSLSPKSENKVIDEEYDDEYDDEFITKNLSQLSLSVYFYFIIGQHMNEMTLPCVYASDYIFLTCIPLCLHMIEEKRMFTIHKGLVLLDSLLNKLEDNTLPQLSLEVTNHLDMYKSLTHVMIQSYSKECRVLALKCFKDWLKKFDNEGKYRLFTTVFETESHSGVLGVLIHEFKENIRMVKKTNTKDSNFTGLKLQNLIRLACKLPSGETTDLLDKFDNIMGALNLLVYICLCDTDNTLSFKPILPLVLKDFLEPIEKGLRISKGHYQLKLKDVEEGKNQNEPKLNVEIHGEETFSGIPIEKQKELILQSLNCLDIMHSTWARANQLVTDFKVKS